MSEDNKKVDLEGTMDLIRSEDSFIEDKDEPLTVGGFRCWGRDSFDISESSPKVTGTMGLEWERNVINDLVDYLKSQNAKLTEQLINLQRESNKAILELKDEIKKLRNEIKEIEEARALRVELPDSWIIED